MSLDGRTAMASGESQWITGPAARADVQRLRAAACAVVTGVNTVLIDNPSLNVRPEQWQAHDLSAAQLREIDSRQPLRVIVDSALRTPPQAKILTLPGDALVLTCSPHGQHSQRFAETGAMLREVTTEQGGRVDLRAAMQTLAAEFSCNEVLLEAGPTLSGAMIKAGLVDEVIIYIGAMLLGSDAQPLLNLPGLRQMADRVRLDIIDVRTLDGDCRITARVIHH
jgi:diaminohydroxyphosphoribosylaminopyrimidine deaminase/5-amino-6-(5-phosphoribosylamino)uracil reductase